MTPILSISLNPLLLPTPTPTPTPTLSTLTPTQTGLTFRTKLLYLESLNINSITALSLNPNLRTTPLTSLQTLTTTLTSPPFSLPQTSLGRIFNMFPNLLTTSPTTLLSISHFLLHHANLPPHHLSRAIIRCPRLLLCDLDSQLIPALHFLRHNLRFRHVTAQTCLLLVSSVDRTLTPKIDFLKNLGFREEVVINMVQRSPAILTYSVDGNLRPKVEFFVEVMKGDLEEIVRFPQYFSFSLEKRIKVRFELLEEFRVSMSLKDMLMVNDGEFDLRLLEMRVGKEL